MSVSLHPSNSLGFKRPLTQVVKRSLTITNHNAQPVAFKVKTTAPKLYCVRPNSGRVDPGDNVEVSVMLQALPEEPPSNAKCKDKFLIQSTLITAEKETMPLQAIWASPETGEEGKVHQQKLRVTYLPADGQTLEEEDETEHKPSAPIGESRYAPARGHDGYPEAAPESTEAPAQELFQQPSRPFTPAAEFSRENSNEDSANEVPMDVYANAPQHPTASPPQPVAPELAPELASALAPGPASAPAPEPEPEPRPMPPPEPSYTFAPAPSAVTQPDAELLAKLQSAQSEIDHLRATLATMSEAPPTELRRRMRTFSDAGSVAETEVATVIDDSHYHHQEGVPLQVVVIVALAVFITTYLFF